MSGVVELRARRGRWIPWTFVLGFAAVVAANLVMVAYALKTYPGLADPAAYSHGAAYNRVLAEAARQDALGWRLAPRLDQQAGGEAFVVVRATRADGAPLDGLALTGRLTRPVDAPAVVDLALAGEGDGVYRARVVLPRAGQWDLHLVATSGGDRLDMRQRMLAR